MRGRRIAGEAAGIVLTAAVLVGYFTYPLARHPASLGRIDSGDGQFSIWNIGWVARAIATSRDAFDANIFHPHRETLAYSELNLGAGLLGVPAYLATGSAVAAHNWAVLIGLALSVIGMALLVRHLTGRSDAGLTAGILYSFCPYVFAHTAHTQLLMIFGVPWVMLAFHRFVGHPSVGRAIALGAALGVQALFCGYYGILAGILVTYAMLFFAVARGLWRRPSWWLLGGLAAAVPVAMVLPFFLPFLRLGGDGGFRTLAEARLYSAGWRAYLASSAWAHTWMLVYIERWREVLFPGFVSLALASTAVIAAFRQPNWLSGAMPNSRETVLFYAGLVLLAFWISLGPDAGLYALFYQIVPVFTLLRAPARFGLAVSFGLAVLSGIAAAALLARARPGWPIAAAIAGLAVLDLSMTMPFRTIPPPPRAYEVLASLPPAPVVEFPFFYRPEAFHFHARYVFNSIYHWRPLINGYSDHIPEDFREMAPLLASFPNPEGFIYLRERRARYVVIHPDGYRHKARLELQERLEAHRQYLYPHFIDSEAWLYQIVRWPPYTADVKPLLYPRGGGER
ncbi:MAG TPA: hypothetical protein VLD67_09895 [Vicinamibacterales bacterium]|nr:hypothetical protein [Vicinamibacterales bacterium]